MTSRIAGREGQNNLIRAGAGLALILAGIALFFYLRNLSLEGASEPSLVATSVKPVAVDFPAPELALADLDGKSVSLADYRQSVLLVNNWATWCPACKAEMPTLAAYYEAHVREGLMIVAIEAGEGRDEVQPFVQAYGLKFDVWLDPHNASLRAFGNGNLPNSYVIDRTGTVRYAWTGPIDRETLEQYITPLLARDHPG